MKRGVAAQKRCVIAGCWRQRDNRKIHVGLSLTTGRDNNKDPHLRHPTVEQLSQLWRTKTAWGDFMKRGVAVMKTLLGNMVQL